MADLQVKAKVTARTDFARPASRGPPSRPSSPSKTRVAAHATSASTPPIRPKAKVSSSAQVGGARKPQVNSSSTRAITASHVAAGAQIRSPSPFKQLETRSGRASPAHFSNFRSRTDSRSVVSASVPPSPRMMTRPPSVVRVVPSESSLSAGPSVRPRHASVSSASQMSASSSTSNQRGNGLLSPASTMEPTSSEPDAKSNGGPTPIRVTSKVSGMVKKKSSIVSSPLHASSSPAPASSTTAPSKPPSPVVAHLTATPPSPVEHHFYPITTASPAANTHRFTTTRQVSSSFSRSPLPYTIVKSDHTANVKADPTSIPLPPLSPPSSAVSYSSQSSASPSSYPKFVGRSDTVSSVSTSYISGHVRTLSHDSIVRDGTGLMGRIRSASELRPSNQSPLVNVASEEERKVRAEAKSNRKIADLEITNKSLLVINASLEETKHRQAREIRDLRRRLRESRLILPPRTFKKLKAGESSSEHDEDEDNDEDDDSEIQDAGTSHPTSVGRRKEDETFERVRVMLANLLETAKNALESNNEDDKISHVGTKVLHETEARTWRDRGFGNDSDDAGDISVNIDEESSVAIDSENDDGDGGSYDYEVMPPSALHNGNNSLRSEDEVEELMHSFHVTYELEG